MSEHETVFISTGDYFLLQGLNLPESSDRDILAAMLRRKLDTAIIAFPSDIGSEVITTGRKVRYRIGSVRTEERTLIAGSNDPSDGLALRLMSPQGLALIGMSVGHSVVVRFADGTNETLTVEAVCGAEAPRRTSNRGTSKQLTEILPFRLRQRSPADFNVPAEGGDDPGPTAA